jgi:peptidoglycan/xylan/chitin deacetylase (PgdA/CDA1 family)
VSATFFVLGERVAQHPALLGEIVAAGHDVQLHGHGHLRHPDCDRAAVAADLEAALAALGTAGVAPTRWRVPWGRLAPFSAELAAARGLALTGWTLDTRDWDGAPLQALRRRVEPGLADGGVVLAHDGIGPGALRQDAAATAALVVPLVDAARARGLEPGPLTPGWPVRPDNPDE